MKNRLSIKTAYTLLCAFIFVITLLSFCSQLFIMRNMLLANTRQLLEAAHKQSYDNIEHYLDNVENVAISIGYNASVQHYLKEDDSVKRLALYSDVQTVFSGLSTSQSDVKGFTIYDKNGYIITANGSNHKAIIQNDTIDLSYNITYSSFYPSNPYIGVSVPYYIMTIPVLDSNSVIIKENRIGTIVFTMSPSYIKNQIDTGNQLKGCNMVLLDKEGHAIVGPGADFELSEEIKNGDSYVLLDDSFSTNGWQLITYFEKDIIADNMIPLLFTVMAISLLIVVMVLTFVFLLSRRFISPINHISHFMNEVSKNASERINKSVHPYTLPKKWNYEELASMANTMNGMLKSLDEKTEELLNKEKQYYEAVLSHHKTEILAYRNQINPHFLYNTFECIKGIALSHNAPEVVEISQALSQMFRYAVKGDNYVTVEEELANIQEYAQIIYYRFMGRISISIDATSETMSYYIPRLILQPIVENAVFHGLEQKIGPGNIEVTVDLKKDALHMKVKDNGLGIKEATVQELLQYVTSPSDNASIGLSNISHRLRLFYGDESQLKISSNCEGGTIIEIILPARKEVKEDVPSDYCR